MMEVVQLNDDNFLPQLTSSSDDWLNQLQLFDLPQFFLDDDNNTNLLLPLPYSPTNDDIINTKDLIQNIIPQEEQHPAPGPIKRSPSNINNSYSSSNIANSNKASSLIDKPNTTKSAVTLTRDQLLSFTSEDLDKFERDIMSTHAFTPAERREMKKQRRLIKNRESAQQSRRRKKDLVDKLERVVGDLAAVNKNINAKLQELEAQNTILKAEVSQLYGVIRDSPILSKLLNNVTSMLVYNAMQATEAKKITSLISSLPQSQQNPIVVC